MATNFNSSEELFALLQTEENPSVRMLLKRALKRPTWFDNYSGWDLMLLEVSRQWEISTGLKILTEAATKGKKPNVGGFLSPLVNNEEALTLAAHDFVHQFYGLGTSLAEELAVGQIQRELADGKRICISQEFTDYLVERLADEL